MTQGAEQDQLAKIGERIRARRNARGLSLHQLARLCGISAPALSLIETGKRDLRVSSVYRIAAALRLPAGELLDAHPSDSPARKPDPGEGYDLGDYL